MNDEKSAFLTTIKDRTAALSAAHPGFEVFALAEAKVLSCIGTLDFRSFSGPDYLVMHRLRQELEKQPTEDGLWSLAYIDLWYCSNFSGLYWRELTQLDNRNIRFAIQAALSVWCCSGRDSSMALAKFIKACCCWAEARKYLVELRKRKEWRGWIEKVLHTCRQ